MAVMTRVLLLLAVLTCCAARAQDSGVGCLCRNDINGRLPSRSMGSIVDVQIHPVYHFCDKVEIIVTLKTTSSSLVQYCLDPKSPGVEKFVKKFVK